MVATRSFSSSLFELFDFSAIVLWDIDRFDDFDTLRSRGSTSTSATSSLTTFVSTSSSSADDKDTFLRSACLCTIVDDADYIK